MNDIINYICSKIEYLIMNNRFKTILTCSIHLNILYAKAFQTLESCFQHMIWKRGHGYFAK